ncbi:MAG TPA: ParA family protein [Candidatus Saccharimonadales bacterium]
MKTKTEMAVIAITNQKGGVGKTTTTINVAFYMAKAGKRVLLVDGDPQGNTTSGLGVEKQKLEATLADVLAGNVEAKDVIRATSVPGVDLLPSLPQLADVEVQLAAADKRFSRLKLALEPLAYDVILIDCPPSLSLLTVNALIAADRILLPVQAEFYALEGLGQLLETMKLIKERMNAKLDLLGVVLTMYDGRTTLSQQVLDEVKKHFPGKVFETVIPRNVRLAEAPSHGVPVGMYDKWSKGARAYKTLTKEIMKRLEEAGQWQ